MNTILFKITFIPRFIRQFFYKRFNPVLFKSAGASVGNNFKVYNRVYLKLYRGGKLKIGDSFTMTSGEAVNPISRNVKACLFINNNAILNIGNNVGMSSPCIWCNERISIGNNVKCGALVTILDSDCHSLNFVDRQKGGTFDVANTKCKPIVIGDDVLIGCNSIILKGVSIGARTIIGAGSVVSCDIPADCIAAGNPCKVIRFTNK